jgi:hypothetical protein
MRIRLIGIEPMPEDHRSARATGRGHLTCPGIGRGEDHRRVKATGRGRLSEFVRDRGEGHRSVRATGRVPLAGLRETRGRRLALVTNSSHWREGTITRGDHLLATTTASDLRLLGHELGTGAKPPRHVLHLAPAINTGMIRDGPGHLVTFTEVDDRGVAK